MSNKETEQEIKEINQIAAKLSCVLEVVANSCNYNGDYGSEEILRHAINYQNEITEKLITLNI